jgi:cytochrome c oxidase accessory protein FixG
VSEPREVGNGAAATPSDAHEEFPGFAPLDLYQKREKIYTRKVSGRFQRLQLYTGWPLLLAYFVTPWLHWDDRQAVLFDLPARRFYVFGLTFWPQDLWLLGLLLIISAFALFTFTSLVGRLWCGYTCPQTVWTSIFTWIEQRTEGPRHQRIRLDAAPWTLEKLYKRSAKHGLWVAFAFLTGLTFVGYFTPIRTLSLDLPVGAAGGWSLFWIGFFTLATYVNAGWFREQVCIYMCPYARFQSVMHDADTLVVSYDARRGEPRASRKRGLPRTSFDLGDCTDCQLCVQVCPVGIDIREGFQAECIGCARCIDACDQVMDRMGYARGLVRYTTAHRIRGMPSRLLRPHVIGYAAALSLVLSLFTYMLVTRDLIGIEVMRDRGDLFQVVGSDWIRNGFSLQLINKTQSARTFELRVATLSGEPLEFEGPTSITADAGEVLNIPIAVLMPWAQRENEITRITFTVCADAACATRVSHFFSPG